MTVPSDQFLNIVDIYGQCACGAVAFKLSSADLKAYQCHCSLCRKATGSVFSTTVMVPEEDLTWLAGEDQVSFYSRTNGYKLGFCSHCGSPLPNRFRGYPLYSVPAGSLDGRLDIDIVVQLNLDSAAPWDSERRQGTKFKEMPSLDEMIQLLHLRV